jgi:hypothetical protein
MPPEVLLAQSAGLPNATTVLVALPGSGLFRVRGNSGGMEAVDKSYGVVLGGWRGGVWKQWIFKCSLCEGLFPQITQNMWRVRKEI